MDNVQDTNFFEMDSRFFGSTAPGGVVVLETRIPAGAELDSHHHKHDHLSILVSGAVTLTVGEVTVPMDGFNIVTIPANVTHGVAAIRDAIWLCVWAADVAPMAGIMSR